MKVVTITAAAVLIALIGLAVAIVIGPPTVTLSPTAIRPWAEASFDQRIRSSAPLAWPTIPPSSAPIATVTREAGAFFVKQNSAGSPEAIDWKHFERVEVGPSMQAQLPHVQGATVKLLYWRAGESPWLSPLDGNPVDPQPTGIRHRRTSPRKFSFALKVDHDSLRHCRSTLFDRTTKVTLSAGQSSAEPNEEENLVLIDVMSGVRHRAKLLLEVQVTYGPPEVRELELTAGNVRTFGAVAQAQFLARGVSRFRSRRSLTSRSTPTGREPGFQWDPVADSERGRGWVSVAIVPCGLRDKFQACVPGETQWRVFEGSDEIPLLSGVPASVESIKLRYLQHAARLQFRLPPPSTLPVVEDLLRMQLGDIEFNGYQRVGTFLRQALQLDWENSRVLNFDRFKTATALRDATTADVLALIFADHGPSAYLDVRQFRLEPRRGSASFRFQSWFNMQARRLGL